MKSPLAALILATGATMISVAASAQEQNGCFMLDSNGRAIDLSALCGQSPQQTAPTGVYRVPIKRRQGGIPIIDVTFNRRTTFEMFLDTGASGIALPPHRAQELGIVPERTVRVNTPSDRNVSLPLGRVATVEVGGAVVNDLAVIIAPELSIGLLGQEFFRDYDIVIKQNVVELHRR